MQRIYRTGTFQKDGATELELRLTHLIGCVETETKASELMTSVVACMDDARRELQGMRTALYCKSSGGVSLVSGAKLPEWDGLSPEIRRAWDAAAQAVVGVAVMGSPDAQ